MLRYLLLVVFLPLQATAQDWGSYRLSVHGFGPVRVGMSVAEASSVVGNPLVLVDGAGGGSASSACKYYRPSDGPPGLMFMAVDDRIVRIDVDDDSGVGRFKTISGGSIGHSEKALNKVYQGRLKRTPHQTDTRGEYFVFEPRNSTERGSQIIFETVDGRVTFIRAGRLPEVAETEGCS